MTQTSPTEEPPVEVLSAIDRGLAKRRADAAREVESIMDAALRVAERDASAAPRVADIVAEAATSNQAFYRYFAGKDDLLRAVYARGLKRLQTYLSHQVDKSREPSEQIEAWVRGVLAQVTDRTAARQSAALTRQLGMDSMIAYVELSDLREPLSSAIRRAGSRHVELDSVAVCELTFAIVRRHVQAGTVPSAAECDHLVGFVLAGVGLGPRA